MQSYRIYLIYASILKTLYLRTFHEECIRIGFVYIYELRILSKP